MQSSFGATKAAIKPKDNHIKFCYEVKFLTNEYCSQNKNIVYRFLELSHLIKAQSHMQESTLWKGKVES